LFGLCPGKIIHTHILLHYSPTQDAARGPEAIEVILDEAVARDRAAPKLADVGYPLEILANSGVGDFELLILRPEGNCVAGVEE
jgi:hypothetical protein